MPDQPDVMQAVFPDGPCCQINFRTGHENALGPVFLIKLLQFYMRGIQIIYGNFEGSDLPVRLVLPVPFIESHLALNKMVLVFHLLRIMKYQQAAPPGVSKLSKRAESMPHLYEFCPK